MGFRSIPLPRGVAFGGTSPAPPAVPAPEGPPAAPDAPPAPQAPAEAEPCQPLAPWLPAGLEAARGAEAAEVAELGAGLDLESLATPFALCWLCGAHLVFNTWHTVTYSHLRHQRRLVLSRSEWDALTQGAIHERTTHKVIQWMSVKVRHPLSEITTDLAMGDAVAELTTRTLTIAQVGKAWGFSLVGLAYGPK